MEIGVRGKEDKSSSLSGQLGAGTYFHTHARTMRARMHAQQGHQKRRWVAISYPVACVGARNIRGRVTAYTRLGVEPGGVCVKY